MTVHMEGAKPSLFVQTRPRIRCHTAENQHAGRVHSVPGVLIVVSRLLFQTLCDSLARSFEALSIL
ncbi:hypothetical protein DPMN_031450 [Dreissena polymorpha]|uniref:Uncharacterized protein n=1 Tax=Dreissena polymorpha TaxID=45954 RepID=A0A9D4RJ42_DREPO|nr:hypothetical protein DPMN_031450 [Dreissena polymorpha]